VDIHLLNTPDRDEAAIGTRRRDCQDQADRAPAAPSVAVTALYEVHAVGFLRLAVVMLGDPAAAEDVVQDAFCGLYRRWRHLDDPARALQYLRSAVLNGCRSQLRARTRAQRRPAFHAAGHATSAEDDALIAAEHHEVLAALRGLPARQREALVLRFYLDLSEPDIAAAMGISQGTVKSTTSRAIAALGRLLQEDK
jgi:RNA polymerase sigma-70 factor (sigma-E family)